MSSDSRRFISHLADRLRSAGRSYPFEWEVPASVAPYVPTPINIVKKMLEVGGAGPDDIVYDLGCGDGRILFTAIEEFNVKKAVGYELNASMCEAVMRKVKNKSLEDRIEVINGNFFLADLSSATLITLYLTTSGNTKLKPKFEKELRDGTRIVSHDFPINGWMSMRIDEAIHNDIGSHRIYLYRVPDSFKWEEQRGPGESEGGRWSRIRDAFRGAPRS
ncbi:MAG: class I SAM-dependent methyltransferase [Candidatus Bathyarchaeia archaeon]